jgi:3-methyladenine DNA glycosylase AlkD
MSRDPFGRTIQEPMRTLILKMQQSLAAMPAKNAPSFHLVRQKWSGQLKEKSSASVIALAKALVSRGIWERILAYAILAHHQSARAALRPKDITALGRGMQSWGEVDCFACYVAGPAWREGSIPSRLIHSWARSGDHWWRRAALVSTVPLNNRTRGGNGDPTRTLSLCRLLVRDRDDMVVKALSWALRELSKRDQIAVKGFLERHDRHLAPRVIREVTNKLRTGLKNPRRVSAG